MIIIARASVIVGAGADKVMLWDAHRREAVFPYKEPLVLSFEAAAGTGVDYVRNNFGIEPDIVRTK
jgi:hypothetical protein